jgi:1-aminocyclopropane-1-carboxylate deaminase/D-cysteine desulfhydrase-like pyridoxal-dependent ACC family enzyme
VGSHLPRVVSVREAIDQLARVRLAATPTPLEYAPRLTKALGGPRIYIKRDDLTGLAFGGNKTRMFEFVLGKAVHERCDAVVGGSAVQSNYSRQLAAACARLGLACYLVLRRVRGNADNEVQGSLLIDLLVGAHVQLVDDDPELHAAALRALVKRLRLEGHRVYLARQASEADNALHAVAYVDAVLELGDQVAAMGIDPGWIYVASLDTTHAGLLAGLRATAAMTKLRAVSPIPMSIWPGRSIEQEVARIANEVSSLLGLGVIVGQSEPDLTTAYAGARYGEVTRPSLEAIRLFARTEGILLDPVYTSKAAAALIDHVRQGRLTKHDTVVFWHTGGQPALFAYAPQLDLDQPYARSEAQCR